MKKRIIKCIAILIVVFGTVSVIFLIMFDKSFSYQLEMYSKREAVNTINREINEVILEELSESGITYSSLINSEKNNNGEITCINANMVEVNKLKNKLDLKIAEICECDNEFGAKIPMGNLVGGGLLYGKGFDIKVKFRPIGEANTRMTGGFTEAGINQTIYRISFDANINIAIVFPFRYIEIPIKIETVIAETVILGKVPESFTYFNMEGEITDEEFQGFVEDFRVE